MVKVVLPPHEKMGNMLVFKLEGDHIKRTGEIQIVPLDDRKQLNLSFRCVKDSKTNIWYGIPEGVDHLTGRVTFKRITIAGKRTYHLEYPADAEEFAVIMRHPAMLGSLLASKDKTFGKPLIKVHDVVAIATNKLKDIDLGADAVHIARKELSGVELMDFARVLGITTDNNNEIVVSQLVAEKALREPKVFMLKYHDGNRDIVMAFKRAESVGLISYTLEGGYVYKDGLPLGGSEIAAINKIRGNTDLLTSIDLESKELLLKVDEEPEPVKPTPAPIVSEPVPVEPIPPPAEPVAEVPEEPVVEEEPTETVLETTPKVGDEKPLKEDPQEELESGPTDLPADIPGGAEEVNLNSEEGSGLSLEDEAVIGASGGPTDSDPGDAPQE